MLKGVITPTNENKLQIWNSVPKAFFFIKLL